MMFHSHHPSPSFCPLLRPQRPVYLCCFIVNPAISSARDAQAVQYLRLFSSERALMSSPSIRCVNLWLYLRPLYLFCHGCTHVMIIDISSLHWKSSSRKSLLFTTMTPLYTSPSYYPLTLPVGITTCTTTFMTIIAWCT